MRWLARFPILVLLLLPACESGGGELERLKQEAALARRRAYAAEQRLEHLVDSVARLPAGESDSAGYRAATALLREQVVVVREARSQARLAERDLGRFLR